MVQRISSRLHLENDSTPRGEEWWDWSVWVEGPIEELDAIEHVTYRLHPTFPEPIRRVTDRESKFRLASAGWGEFSIFATVQVKGGEIIRLERWLELGKRVAARGLPDKQRPLRVFISHGLVDAPLVHELYKALKQQGIDVMRVDAEKVLDEYLRSADAVVPVISNPPNSWVEAEANRAIEMDRLVVPIVVAPAETPTALSNILRLELGVEKNITELANTLASRLKDELLED